MRTATSYKTLRIRRGRLLTPTNPRGPQSPERTQVLEFARGRGTRVKDMLAIGYSNANQLTRYYLLLFFSNSLNVYFHDG